MTRTSANPINKLSANNRFTQAGFTLLEVLIALAIATLMLSVATIAFGDDELARLENKSRQLYGLLQIAQEESIIRGVEIGVVVEPQRYSFMIYNGDKWQPLEDHRLLREITFEEPLKAYVNVEGQESLLKNAQAQEESSSGRDGKESASEEESDEPKKPLDSPQIFMLSSGEMNEFVMTIGLDRDEPVFYRITGNYVGEIELSNAIKGHYSHDWDLDLDDEQENSASYSAK